MMVWKSNRRTRAIQLLAPVLLLVFAATLTPVELRPLGHFRVSFDFGALDAILNVGMYFAVGIVLGELGLWRAVLLGALLSAFAETCQLAMLYRVTSAIDFSTNVLGTILGAAVSVRWGIRSPDFRMDRWSAAAAAAAALAAGLIVYDIAGPMPNERGVRSPGILEASWKLDDASGQVALDSSGHGINGRFMNEPSHANGAMGSGAELDGRTDYIDFGRSRAFRLSGSMTISAWINSSSFPTDDAAIVSHYFGASGYQLDTTVDRGPRTVGFKLTNTCRQGMIRYGATPLLLHSWYHVAGVYNAEKRTLDVYLNGQLDNGEMAGHVTDGQRSSRSPLFVGRRSDFSGFEFAGMIRDVRIYSFALTGTEVQTVMSGGTIANESALPGTGNSASGTESTGESDCPALEHTRFSESGDDKLPAAVGVMGVLIAVAVAGFWPYAGPLPCILASLAGGLLLLPAIAPNLPSFNLWTIPLLSMAGGASVAISLKREDAPRSKT